jgi:hypothetical protein
MGGFFENFLAKSHILLKPSHFSVDETLISGSMGSIESFAGVLKSALFDKVIRRFGEPERENKKDHREYVLKVDQKLITPFADNLRTSFRGESKVNGIRVGDTQ